MVGILGRAQELYPVQIHAAVAASNHYHLILTPEDLDQLGDFMEFVNGNLAREAGRLIGWHGSLWTDRFHHVPVSPEPQALVERLRAAKLRDELGTKLVGMETIRHQDPLSRPVRSKHSPKPPCHAASKDMRKRFRQANRGFVDMFREASLQIKFGNVTAAVFPKGSFPPALPFVRTGHEFDPLADAGGSRAFGALLAAAA